MKWRTWRTIKTIQHRHGVTEQVVQYDRVGLIWYIHVGERAPRWLGTCWYDIASRRYGCAPIPLNVIFRAVWLVWCWLRNPMPDSVHEMKHQEGHG